MTVPGHFTRPLDEPSVWRLLPGDAALGRPERRTPLFVRLWLGFLTGRVMLALVLVCVPLMILPWSVLQLRGHHMVAVIYLGLALVQRFMAGFSSMGRVSERLLVLCIVIDGVAIAVLNDPSVRVVNYYALLALPLLYASVLGSRRVAMASAAAVSLMLLSDAWRLSLALEGDASARFLQAGLTGAGAWVAVLLVHFLAERLEGEVHSAQISRDAARTQVRVNELVIAGMTDGVLVVDDQAQVHTANPAARRMLGLDEAPTHWPVALASRVAWAPLLEVVRQTFETRSLHKAMVELSLAGQGVRGVQLSARLTSESLSGGAGDHCVVFMEDLQELRARVRTEKMAAMGRMSAAVAHEIRNPLAAISQANALLREDLQDARLQRLSGIVSQNADRLRQTVDDILDVTRFPKHPGAALAVVDLTEQVARICDDWQGLQPGAALVRFLPDRPVRVRFDAEHLRRLLVNLLDNAKRHAQGVDVSDVRVWVGSRDANSFGEQPTDMPVLMVWNAGAPLDAAIGQHLFEPFFSSQSRSSGLGLYICRQLCEGHEAQIRFDRAGRPGLTETDGAILGNQFTVIFQPAPAVPGVDQP
jgi:two-component system, NtrC family, sensor histidine kinase PilS